MKLLAGDKVSSYVHNDEANSATPELQGSSTR